MVSARVNVNWLLIGLSALTSCAEVSPKEKAPGPLVVVKEITGGPDRVTVERLAKAPSAVRSEAEKAAFEAAGLYGRGDLAGAVEYLREATAQHPKDAQLEFMLGNALFRQEDWEGAVEHYEKSARMRRIHPDTHLGIGSAYYRLGRFDQAVRALRTAVSQSPSDALPRLSLALALNVVGRYDEARGHMSLAIRQDADWYERISIDVRWTTEMLHDVRQFASQIDGDNVAIATDR